MKKPETVYSDNILVDMFFTYYDAISSTIDRECKHLDKEFKVYNYKKLLYKPFGFINQWRYMYIPPEKLDSEVPLDHDHGNILKERKEYIEYFFKNITNENFLEFMRIFIEFYNTIIDSGFEFENKNYQISFQSIIDKKDMIIISFNDNRIFKLSIENTSIKDNYSKNLIDDLDMDEDSEFLKLYNMEFNLCDTDKYKTFNFVNGEDINFNNISDHIAFIHFKRIIIDIVKKEFDGILNKIIPSYIIFNKYNFSSEEDYKEQIEEYLCDWKDVINNGLYVH